MEIEVKGVFRIRMDEGENSGQAQSPYGVWDKVRVSKSLFDLLIQHPGFQKEPKAINTAQYWLSAIDAAMERNDGDPVTWDFKDIANRFQGYSQSYTKFRDALRDLGLIKYSTYRRPPNAFVQGECREFVITPRGRELVSDGNHKWLYQLIKDPDILRRNQVAISKRGVKHQVYAEPEKHIIHAFNAAVEFDWDAVLKQLEQDKVHCPSRRKSALHHLLALKRRAFSDLEIKNGRIYNEFVGLPNQYRRFALFKGKPYVATLDIRACWPTFLGMFLRDFFELFTDNPPQTSDPEDVQRTATLRAEVDPATLKVECGRWTDMFIDTGIDPREAIMRGAGMSIDRRDMKQCLNTWLNGAKKYQRETDGRWNLKDNKALEGWFSRSFPELAKVWATFPRRATGRMISENYEGRLMLNPGLYAFGDEMGLTLSYEYDGVGVFAERGEPELSAKLENVQAFIEHQSFEQFGLPVVAKIEVLA